MLGSVKQSIRRVLNVNIRRRVRHLNPTAKFWYWSSIAYRKKLHPVAWTFKAINFFVFKAILCYENELTDDLDLVHFGFGCVSHPNVTLGHRVKLFHHVTFASETRPGSSSRIVVEDDVTIGAYAILIGNDAGGIRIGKGATIGAGAIVTRDVAPGAVVVPLPSRPVKIA